MNKKLMKAIWYFAQQKVLEVGGMCLFITAGASVGYLADKYAVISIILKCFLGLVLLCGLSMILYTNWQWAKERAEITEED